MATNSLFKRKRASPDEPDVVGDDHPAADMTNYVFAENLGTGAYAKVVLARVKATGAKVKFLKLKKDFSALHSSSSSLLALCLFWLEQKVKL